MREVIGRLILIKESLAVADVDQIFPYFLPEIRASAAQIEHLAQASEFRLPKEYEAFLSAANGWRYVLVSTSLLGTDEIPSWQQDTLQRGEVLSGLAQRGVKAFLVIGASDADDNLYLIDSEGRVHWYARGEIETFPSFAEFMECLLAHNEELLAEVRDGRWRL